LNLVLSSAAGLRNDIEKTPRSGKAGVRRTGMAQDQQYEIWTRDVSDWVLKSSWRDFEIAVAAARARSGPVRIVLAEYHTSTAPGRSVVVELGVPSEDHQPAVTQPA